MLFLVWITAPCLSPKESKSNTSLADIKPPQDAASLSQLVSLKVVTLHVSYQNIKVTNVKKKRFGQTSVSRACLHDIKRLSQVIVWLNGYLVTVCTCKQSWSMCQCQGLMTVDEGSKNLILYLLMCWFQFWFSLWSKSAVLLVAIIMYLSAGN